MQSENKSRNKNVSAAQGNWISVMAVHNIIQLFLNEKKINYTESNLQPSPGQGPLQLTINSIIDEYTISVNIVELSSQRVNGTLIL